MAQTFEGRDALMPVIDVLGYEQFEILPKHEDKKKEEWKHT